MLIYYSALENNNRILIPSPTKTITIANKIIVSHSSTQNIVYLSHSIHPQPPPSDQDIPHPACGKQDN
jgi:hypothetical protein